VVIEEDIVDKVCVIVVTIDEVEGWTVEDVVVEEDIVDEVCWHCREKILSRLGWMSASEQDILVQLRTHGEKSFVPQIPNGM
jgi:hypothetical protein